MQKILRVDFENHKITVEGKEDPSKIEVYTTSNEHWASNSTPYKSMDNPDLNALLFLSCNIADVFHYGISVVPGKEIDRAVCYLIKSSDFRELFIEVVFND